MMFVVLFK